MTKRQWWSVDLSRNWFRIALVIVAYIVIVYAMPQRADHWGSKLVEWGLILCALYALPVLFRYIYRHSRDAD